MTSLEGCGGDLADQQVRSSGGWLPWPWVTVIDCGSLPDRARSGHAHGSGGRPRDRTNLGADLRRLHEWWRRQRRSFRACSGSPFVRAGL